LVDLAVAPLPQVIRFGESEADVGDELRTKNRSQASDFLASPALGLINERRHAANPNAHQPAAVLAAVKMLWGGRGETYPSLH
jgi:hypothetical protein